MRNLIKSEAGFVKDELVHNLSLELPEQEKRVVEIRYGLDYGGIVNFANGYLHRLIKAIKKCRMSLDGFGNAEKEIFNELLNSDRLDGSLQRELSSLLYDPKMREKYFK